MLLSARPSRVAIAAMTLVLPEPSPFEGPEARFLTFQGEFYNAAKHGLLRD